MQLYMYKAKSIANLSKHTLTILSTVSTHTQAGVVRIVPAVSTTGGTILAWVVSQTDMSWYTGSALSIR